MQRVKLLGKTGRPKGSQNQRTIIANERMLQAMQTGYLPHEFLLMVCRGEPIQHGTNEDGTPHFIIPDFQDRIDAAAKAAPYFAPRLSAIEVIKGVSDEDLDAIIQGAAIEAGLTVTETKQLTAPDGVQVYEADEE